MQWSKLMTSSDIFILLLCKFVSYNSTKVIFTFEIITYVVSKRKISEG